MQVGFYTLIHAEICFEVNQFDFDCSCDDKNRTSFFSFFTPLPILSVLMLQIPTFSKFDLSL